MDFDNIYGSLYGKMKLKKNPADELAGTNLKYFLIL
jgi:hypothetical protein